MTQEKYDIIVLHHPDGPGTLKNVCNNVGAQELSSRQEVDEFIEQVVQ